MRTLPAILFGTTVLFSIAANAQKLPNVQKESVRAPADIKVDGKTTEWNNGFKAYNHATDIFYTISNDDQKLYLTVMATQPDVVRKMANGGFTLRIQTSGKKNDNGSIMLNYPASGGSGVPQGIKTGVVISSVTFVRRSSSERPTDQQADSIMLESNKRFEKNAKWIGVLGIAGVDSLLSVYNEEGIKAVGKYDRQHNLTFEFSIDLKLLNLPADGKFAYHITMNFMSPFKKEQQMTMVSVVGMSPAAPSAPGDFKITADPGGMNAPTDFWGEYTLAKKQ